VRDSEAALQRTKRQLRHAADAARLTYAEFDLLRQQAQYAENYASVMGYGPQQPSGSGIETAFKSLLENVVDADRPMILRAIRKFNAGKAPEAVQYRVRGPDGAERWIESLWTAEFRPDRRPSRVFVTDLEVTTLVEGKAALAAAKAEAERANLAKSKFLAAASHDLRQPVQSLVLLLSLIERQIKTVPKALETVKMMNTALNGLNGLLTSVLDISRLDAGVIQPKLEIVDLKDLCERLAVEYGPKAAAAGLEFRTRCRDLRARTDPVLFERALRNLIENALRYTHKGGALLAVRERPERIRVDVIDSGVGIPADKHAEIFEEFSQLDNPGRDLSKGLGLGLAIVARVSALLGLNVEVSSRPGRGSRFSFSLPPARPEAPVHAQPSEIYHGGGRVLVIEDNQVLLFSIVNMLNEWGYETIAAANGEEAVELTKQEDLQLDAIVADFRLGKGINGVDAALEVQRRIGGIIPKVLLTGETAKEQLEKMNVSAFEIMHKPVSADELQVRLGALIHAQSS